MNKLMIADKEIEVHPLAASFPMLPDDELQELADDIASNGLREAIKLDSRDRLIDGRNRFRACGIAGVEPRFETFDGDEDEVIAYIYSTNITRRHLTKGQRAMAMALAYPDPEQRGRGNLKSVKTTDFSASSLSHARLVLHDDPEAARSVMAGALPLHEAYETAKQKTVSEEQRRAALDRLRARSPELAAKVEAGELSMKAAEVEINEREAQARNQRLTLFRAFKQAVEALAILAFEDDFIDLAKTYPAEFAEAAGPGGAAYLSERASYAERGWAQLTADLAILHRKEPDR